MNTASWKSIPFQVSIGLLLAIVLVGILAPVIAPHDPLRGSLRERNVPPAWMDGGSSTHLLGTDHLGRDVLSRLIFGARTLLVVALAPVLAAGIIGGSLGLVAGYYGRPKRLLDVKLLAFPLVLLAILPVLVAQLAVAPALGLALTAGPSFPTLLVLTAMVPVVIFAYQVWNETLLIREGSTFGQALDAGEACSSVDMRHLIPRMAKPMMVLALLLMVYALVLEGILGFYGAGVPPPIASWGAMVAEGRDRLAVAWWISTFPALAVLITVFLLTLLASQLRDRLGPHPGQGGAKAQLTGLLAALLTAFLALGVMISATVSPGHISALAWLVGAAVMWQGYQLYRLPGTRAMFLGFVLLLAGALVGALRWLLYMIPGTLPVSPLAFDNLLFSPVFVLPGLADTPYERIFAWSLAPVIGLPSLLGAILVAVGLWRIKQEAPHRTTGGPRT
jgi:peptide/nickel transport system permease protein